MEIVQSRDSGLCALRAEIGELREAIAAVYLEIDELRLVAHQLSAVYEQQLGPAQIRLIELEWELSSLRKRRALIVAALNRGERPDLHKIGRAIERELKAYEETLREARSRYRAAEYHLENSAPILDYPRVKRLYRELVRALHPDLHPSDGELSGERLMLWTRAREAFESGDLAELERLVALFRAGDDRMDQGDEDERTILEGRRDRLREALSGIEARRERLLARPPLSMRREIEDAGWLSAKKDELIREAARYEAIAAELRIRNAELERSIEDEAS